MFVSSRHKVYHGCVIVKGFIRGLSEIQLFWNDSGLVHINWNRSGVNPKLEGKHIPNRESTYDVPSCYKEPLQYYFDGRDTDLTALPIDFQGTSFQIKVWKALRCIPRGTVCSYSEVAAKIGSPKAARAVGSANKANPLPIVIPCHRVIAAGMHLGGYSGGLDLKRALLRLEGIRIRSDKIVEYQNHS